MSLLRLNENKMSEKVKLKQKTKHAKLVISHMATYPSTGECNSVLEARLLTNTIYIMVSQHRQRGDGVSLNCLSNYKS